MKPTPIKQQINKMKQTKNRSWSVYILSQLNELTGYKLLLENKSVNVLVIWRLKW